MSEIRFYKPEEFGSDVAEILPEQLFEDLKVSPKSFCFLDVRKKSEFRVSRLPEAIRLDPKWEGSKIHEVLQEHAGELRGKRIVFYCTVGGRSSKKAEILQDFCTELGAKEVLHLAYGLMGWVNQDLGHLLVSEIGLKNKIHPYNEEWSSLLKVPSRAFLPKD
jgi:rhodanese-related sulfurtransferase